jgi:hypothetical protein
MYKLVKDFKGNDCGVVLNETKSIPINPDNTDYQEYLKWIYKGNTPLPADEQGEA